MKIENIDISFEDGYYTADIDLWDDNYIITEWKTFDELLKMIDDALQWLADKQSYHVQRTMPAFTFNFSHNAVNIHNN
jgi:hypothetical protein